MVTSNRDDTSAAGWWVKVETDDVVQGPSVPALCIVNMTSPADAVTVVQMLRPGKNASAIEPVLAATISRYGIGPGEAFFF